MIMPIMMMVVMMRYAPMPTHPQKLVSIDSENITAPPGIVRESSALLTLGTFPTRAIKKVMKRKT